MGPIVLFDKSFLQSLSVDESVWFDHYFDGIISPLFFIETLADLEKAPREGRTAEQEVGVIAIKTPQMNGGPCYNHLHLCAVNLRGYPVPMRAQIPVAGGRAVSRNGKIGSIIDEPEEARALRRWQHGDFMAVERWHARAWRQQLANINLGEIRATMKAAGAESTKCKTLEDARDRAIAAVSAVTKSVGRFDAALEVLQIAADERKQIRHRWKQRQRPALTKFSPYAAHVLTIEIFFDIALGAGLISSERASHRADIAYLFYLPFCSIFVSTDRLHRSCAPLFLRADQQFVWGTELKTDLGHLNRHFSTLPDDVKARGLHHFARRLPDESNGLIRELYSQHAPKLLEPEQKIEVTPEMNAKILAEMKQWRNAPQMDDRDVPPNVEHETLILERSVNRRRGSWVQIGADVHDDELKT